MIHFEHPALLYLLLVVPLLVGLFIIVRLRRQRQLRNFADSRLLELINPEESHRRPAAKFTLLMLALALLITTLANPQVGTKMVKGERLGSDIAICLDVSRSMMAEDISPNRLSRSQQVVNSLLDQLGSDRVSIIPFAGSSFIQMPLTNDYAAASLFVDQTNCDMIQAQGTAIGDAIDMAMKSFGYDDPDRKWEKRGSRCIIVISDGENHEDDAVDAAQHAASEGVMVNTIGMGTDKSVPIPIYKGGQMTGYKQDNNGSTITTRLNESMLVEIAQAGKGIYIRSANTASGIREIVKQLEKLEKDNYGNSAFSEYESCYQYPLTLAFLLLIAEILVFEKKNPRINLAKLLKRD